MQKLPVTDHKGKTYRRFEDMCKAWRINPNLVLSRIRKGWDVHKALTTQVDERSTYVKTPNVPEGCYFGVYQSKYTKHLSDKLPRKEYINEISKDLRAMSRTFLKQLRNSTDKNELAYGLWIQVGVHSESVTCLLNLYVKVANFPEIKVFNHAEAVIAGEPLRIFCTAEFLELFNGSEGMIEILEYIKEHGIHTRIQDKKLFLGFKNWGRLMFGSRYITLIPQKITGQEKPE